MSKYVTITEKGEAMNEKTSKSLIAPVTAGELLSEEFLLPMGITKYRIAKDIGVPAQRIGEIVAGKRTITADTDLRLCKYFGLSTGYWLRVQNKYDTEMTRRKIQPQLDGIIPLQRAI
jgi:addiction module HigA family antidote